MPDERSDRLDGAAVDRIRNLLGGDVKALLAAIPAIDNPLVLHVIAANYNWDDGLEVPSRIVENEKCDLGTGLLLFYRADGILPLESDELFASSPNLAWRSYLATLFSMIEHNRFRSARIAYRPELSKTQLFKLRKHYSQVPIVFLEASPGREVSALVP